MVHAEGIGLSTAVAVSYSNKWLLVGRWQFLCTAKWQKCCLPWYKIVIHAGQRFPVPAGPVEQCAAGSHPSGSWPQLISGTAALWDSRNYLEHECFCQMYIQHAQSKMRVVQDRSPQKVSLHCSEVCLQREFMKLNGHLIPARILPCHIRL